jgi:hypothetical protein
MADWKLPWDGGCRCGAVRVRVTRPPLLASACHCTGCQRMTSSAFSLTLTVPSEGFEVVEGDPVTGGLRGPEAHHFHCDQCKSWVFTRAEGMDWFVNLRPSMLDDHGWFEPYIEVWTSEKLPWASTSAARSYPTQPEYDDYEEIMKLYAAEGARP